MTKYDDDEPGLRDVRESYDEGWNARYNGLEKTANPYGFDLMVYSRNWRNGWNDCDTAMLAARSAHAPR